MRQRVLTGPYRLAAARPAATGKQANLGVSVAQHTWVVATGLLAGLLLAACGPSLPEETLKPEAEESVSSDPVNTDANGTEKIECLSGDRYSEFSAYIGSDSTFGLESPELAFADLAHYLKVKKQLKQVKIEYKDTNGSEVPQDRATEATVLFADASGRSTLELGAFKRNSQWHATEMRGCESAFAETT